MPNPDESAAIKAASETHGHMPWIEPELCSTCNAIAALLLRQREEAVAEYRAQVDSLQLEPSLTKAADQLIDYFAFNWVQNSTPDPKKVVTFVRQVVADRLPTLILTARKEAVTAATPEIERRAKVEALTYIPGMITLDAMMMREYIEAEIKRLRKKHPEAFNK